MKRLAFRFALLILVPFILLTSCEDIIGIFIGGGNGAPIIIIYGDDNAPITNGTVSIGNGQSFTITVNATDQDGDALTYKWYINGQIQGAAISSTFTFSETPEIPTQFVIEVRVSDGSEITTGTVTINVDAPDPSVSVTHLGSTIDFGEFLTLTAEVIEGLDTTSLQYAWFVDNIEQIGQTDETFVFYAGSTADTHAIAVEISDGGREGTASTQIHVVAPSVSITPDDDTTGSDDPLTLEAIPSSGFNAGNATYEWRVDGTVQTGETGATFEFSRTVSTTTEYEIEVSVSDGTWNATGATTVTIVAATVTLYASETTIDYGEYLYISTTITGFGSASVSYTWYVNGVEDTYYSGYNYYYLVEYPYPDTTEYTVRVVVESSTQSAEDSIDITVRSETASMVATPTITADRDADYSSSTYYSPVTITIETTTPDATIYYEVSQSYTAYLTTASAEYTGPFTLEPATGETFFYVHAMAVKTGLDDSYSTNTYFSFALGPPALSHEPGTHYDAFSLNVTDAGDDDVFRYTTASYTYPTETSPILDTSSGWPMNTNGYFYVRRFRTGWEQSATSGGYYTISVQAPVPDLAEGTYELSDTTSMVIYLSSETSDAMIYYTDDGSSPDDTDTPYDDSAGITITEDTTIRAIAYSAAMGSSAMTTYLDYYLKAAAPVFSPLGGSFTTVQYVEMTSTTPGAVIRYTRSTSIPYYITSYDGYESPVMLDNDTWLTATAFLPGWSRSDETSEFYDITVGAIDPEFIYRLNLSSLWTTANITNDDGVWFIFTIETDGRYYFNFADSEQGDGSETLDGLVTVFESDRTTPMTDVNARDINAYYSPVDLDLVAGDYYVRVYPQYSGNTGTVRIRIQ